MNRFFACLILCLTAAPVWAGNIIDFETTPIGATPVDNSDLATTYGITGGTVQFFFDTNNNFTFDAGDVLPRFEHVGDDNGDTAAGFLSSRFGGNDKGENGGLGNWFLRQPDGIGSLPTNASFIVDYNVSQKIDALSGEIWDIDGLANGQFEQWQVNALDSTGNILASMTSPKGINFNTDPAASLDSRAWKFTFTGLSTFATSFDKLQLLYIGDKVDGIGLAFDNFDALGANIVPEPSTIASLAFPVLIGVITAARRRRLRLA